MLEDFRQTHISKAIIKFIDIVLDLYSPVPYQIRNQMRILQSTLLYGRNVELQEHIAHLQQKLQLKSKHRQAQNVAVESSISKTPVIKTGRNHFLQSDKQNNFYLDNQRVNTCDNQKKLSTTLNTLNEPQRTRKVSAIEPFNKSFDENQHKKNYLSKESSQHSRNSSRTLLKIVKKNKSTSQKLSITERSSSQTLSSQSLQVFKANVNQILNLMNSNETHFNIPLHIQENDGWKIQYQGF